MLLIFFVSFLLFQHSLLFPKSSLFGLERLKLKYIFSLTYFSKVIDNIIYDLAFSGFVISDLALSGSSHFCLFSLL